MNPLRFIATCALLAPAAALAQAPESRNHPKVLAAFSKAVVQPSQSTVRVLCDGKESVLGVVVKEDGYILTKASELRGKVSVKLADGKEHVAAVVGEKEDYDLALLKIDADKLKAIEWRDPKTALPGMWVATPVVGKEPLVIGVIGVGVRPFKAGDQPPKNMGTNSGYLGVQLEGGEGGAKVKIVMKGSPADKAGLKENDLVYMVGKKTIVDMESLINVVQRQKPGDEIVIKLKRKEESLELKAKLEKLPQQFLGNPQERMGSALSNRRGGFPFILQHDTVLRPSDCGGPLVDLDGKALGLNIARAGRVETYAIPADKIQQLLPDLLSGKLAPKE